MKKNYTTKKELMEMLEGVSEEAPIVLKVRGNSTKDYETNMKIIAFENSHGVLVIVDELSY